MATPKGFPLFKLFTVEEIHRLTGYSEVYLLDIKQGRARANSRFRRVCSAVLQRPESELLGGDASPSPTSSGLAAAGPGSKWTVKGTLIGACNCDWGCPCNFDAPPTYGWCQGTYVWHIQEGWLGDTVLDGLYMSLATESPGALHEGHLTTQFIIDARADDGQRRALLRLLSGEVGGPFEIFAAITETLLDPLFGPFEGSMNGLDSHINVPNILELSLTPIKNPVTGLVEVVQLLKPTGFTSTKTDLGASSVYRLTAGMRHEHSGKYGEFAPFEYSGP